MGAKQGGQIATDIFLETGQERVKISCKIPDIAFVSNSPQKHRHVQGNETVPWNVACIQISSLSLSHSHFGPIPYLSFHRGSVVSQGLVGSMPLPGQPLGLNFSDGRQLRLLCAHLLSTEGWLFP